MTFMRKFMDILNIANRKNVHHDYKNDETYPMHTSEQRMQTETDCSYNEHNNKTLFPNKSIYKNFPQKIYDFWKLHPQVPHGDTEPDASINEYKLYGKVLMLYAIGKGLPIMSSDEYPVYLYREGHITNPHKLHIDLINNEYLVPATNLQMLMARKLPELKILADSIGCAKSGTKAVLANRIISSMDETQLSELASRNDCYYLSQKGKQFLCDNDDYIELHKHANYEISLYEYNLHRFCGRLKRTFTDTVFQTLSQRIYNSCSKSYFFTLEQDYSSLYEIAVSECRYDMAIDSYLHVLYMKTCCFYNVIRMSAYTTQDFDSVLIFSNSVAATLQNMEQFYHPSYITNIFRDLSLPPSFLTESEFSSAVNDMLYETFCDLSKHNKIITKRLIQYNEFVIGKNR